MKIRLNYNRLILVNIGSCWMNLHFSNSALDVWSKYNSFWTWNKSLRRRMEAFWEEWKEWISWQGGLLRFAALVWSRELDVLYMVVWLYLNKVMAALGACILADKLFLSGLLNLLIAANLKQFLSKTRETYMALPTLQECRFC